MAVSHFRFTFMFSSSLAENVKQSTEWICLTGNKIKYLFSLIYGIWI